MLAICSLGTIIGLVLNSSQVRNQVRRDRSLRTTIQDDMCDSRRRECSRSLGWHVVELTGRPSKGGVSGEFSEGNNITVRPEQRASADFPESRSIVESMSGCPGSCGASAWICSVQFHAAAPAGLLPHLLSTTRKDTLLYLLPHPLSFLSSLSSLAGDLQSTLHLHPFQVIN
mmetsp:Transcript_66910/g.145398  ORF Transcript_66910/g.145398 Transcript_66910/m.145398 type:complete len:172 (-) Transcript_66910:45-560(-)